MLFSVFIILVVGAVAYFHYVQGFFSATLSAVLAMIAAMLALSYQEPIVDKLLGGKFADVASGAMLCMLYVVIYIILRTITDKFVPGNMRLPVLADKIGAGVMGLVAGLFAGGVLAVGAQMLPFGATIGMFSRYATADERDVQIPTSGQSTDTFVYNALKDYTINDNRENDRQSLYVPADEFVLGALKRFSNQGSLAGSQSFSTVHPDLLEEIYLDNVGIQLGAKVSAINLNKEQEVKIPNLFTIPSVPQSDAEMDAIRHLKLDPVLKPKPSEIILVVRAMFDRQATDNDNRMRFSPGSCLLVANEKNYYPVGTLENGRHLYADALDDFLISPADKGADLVYILPKADLLADPKAPAGKETVADGVFVDIKRLGRVDLSGKKITEGVTPSPNVEVLRKPLVVKAAGKSGGAPEPVAEGAAAGPLSFSAAQLDNKLPYNVNTGAPEKTMNNFQTASATGALADGMFTKLEVNGTESVQRMSAGSYGSDQLAAPSGYKVVKVQLIPQGDNAWAFENQIANYQLVDDKDQKFSANGIVAKVKTSEGGDRMVAKYNSTSPINDITHMDGRPTDISLYFCVPLATHLKQIDFNGQNLGATDITVQ